MALALARTWAPADQGVWLSAMAGWASLLAMAWVALHALVRVIRNEEEDKAQWIIASLRATDSPGGKTRE